MIRNYFFAIVIIALISLFLIFYSLGREINTPVTKEPVNLPPRAPFKTYISGVGIVEPMSENILIGTPINRVVEKVYVTVGNKVKKGELLLRLEDRDLVANLRVQEAAYQSAAAKLKRLEAFPRTEDLLAVTASLNSAKAELELAKNQYEMVLSLPDPRAISQEEKNRRLSNYQQAEAKWQEAQTNLAKTQAGTWKPDLEIARYEVQRAEANVNRIKTEIERTTIQSPIDGTVLQVKIHKGEPALVDKTPIMILGNIDEMFLRVSINQLDIPYFHSKSPAVAFLQGDAHFEFPLEFVRVEPSLVNKQNLTNEITEKVDTRVLQIIYRIKKDDHRIYVGQQMDVFIETNLDHEKK